MWFDIIKETESERLKRLGYDVPEEMDMASTFNRETIIDKIKEWVNNQEEISPFEEYFQVVSGTSHRSIGNLKYNRGKNTIVVEETGATSYFSDETMHWVEEDGEQVMRPKPREGFPRTFTNKYGDIVEHHHRHQMQDSDMARFYVGVYAINSKEPLSGLNKIDSMDFNPEDIIMETHFPTLRSSSFLQSSLKQTESKIDNDGIIHITGISGNKYEVDFSSGDCNVILKGKAVEFPNVPEWNTTVDASMCISSPRGLPIGDKYASTIFGLKNDTFHAGPRVQIIQLAAKPWIFPKYDNTYDKPLIASKISLTEEGAQRLLRNYWQKDNTEYWNFNWVQG
jgi:hypothetical protein